MKSARPMAFRKHSDFAGGLERGRGSEEKLLGHRGSA
jgi:hypothetical protein